MIARMINVYFLAVLILLLPSPVPGAGDVVVDSLTGLSFTKIPAGEFFMGTENLKAAAAEMPKPNLRLIKDETPRHKVKFEQAFYMATTEVTQALWLKVMSTRPGPAQHWRHPQWQQLPVTGVSWFDTQAFIKTLNQQAKNIQYRLPTEAEWEYVARSGKSGLRPFDILELDDYAWYINTSNDEIQPVAKLEASPWGLYDIYGNVWEWLSDWYAPDTYTTFTRVNPQGPQQGSKKVRRGGSYHCQVHLVRPGYRSADDPDTAYSVLGFRLVIDNANPGSHSD